MKRTLVIGNIYGGQETELNRLFIHAGFTCCNVWNIDTGAAFKGKLTAMDVDTKKFWQSDPVFSLYPGQTGRNKD